MDREQRRPVRRDRSRRLVADARRRLRIHPTNTGYAILANAFIHALNTHFAAGVPPVPVRHVQESDPLVLPGVGHPASALGHVSPETAKSLRALLAC